MRLKICKISNYFLLSRCLHSCHSWRYHCSWWCFDFLLCFQWSWFGSLCDDTYQVVSWDNTVDIWCWQWNSRLHLYSWGVGQVDASRGTVDVTITLKTLKKKCKTKYSSLHISNLTKLFVHSLQKNLSLKIIKIPKWNLELFSLFDLTEIFLKWKWIKKYYITFSCSKSNKKSN